MEFKIKEARILANISQRELAERIGVSPATLSGYESGKHDPRSDLLMEIAEICDCSVDFLLGREVPKTKTPAPEESEAGDKVSMEELTAFLTKAGYIEDGGDLSDSDFEFLAHLIGLLDLWCKSR